MCVCMCDVWLYVSVSVSVSCVSVCICEYVCVLGKYLMNNSLGESETAAKAERQRSDSLQQKRRRFSG